MICLYSKSLKFFRTSKNGRNFDYFAKIAHKMAKLTLFHMGEGADSALLQIVFFITSVRDAAEPRNLVTFPKI